MQRSSARVAVRGRPVTMRRGTPADAEAIYELIRDHQAEGHLLPRSLDEIRRRASRFVVAESAGAVRACAELAALSAAVAEVRSLVVSEDARGKGIGTRLLDEIGRRALDEGHETLAAFTHDPRFFVRRKFSMVPHQWVPEKIARDCAACPLFRRCGQHAMVRSLKEMAPYAGHIEDLEIRRAAVA